MIYLQLFWEFFKTGLFAIGGGLATLPFLYDISAKYGWFTEAELANIMDVIVNAANGLTYTADDYRFVWPIPTREMQVNPQLNGQQNPGY